MKTILDLHRAGKRLAYMNIKFKSKTILSVDLDYDGERYCGQIKKVNKNG